MDDRFKRLFEVVFVAEYLAEVGTKDHGIKAFLIILELIKDILSQLTENMIFYDEKLVNKLDNMIAEVEQNVDTYLVNNVNEALDTYATGMVDSESDALRKLEYADIRHDQRFLDGYISEYDGQQIYVIIWGGEVPTPPFHVGKFVIYLPSDETAYLVHFVSTIDNLIYDMNLLRFRLAMLESRRKFVEDSDFIKDEMLASEIAIGLHYSQLFRDHTNLVAVQAALTKNGVVIRLVVSCKGYIPLGEVPLPKSIYTFKTRVIQGWFRLCGLQGLRQQECLQPGCAIAPVSFASVGQDSPESSFGTVGGYVSAKGTTVAVTVGHLFYDYVSKSILAKSEKVIACPPLAKLILLIYEQIEADLFTNFILHFGMYNATLKMIKRLNVNVLELNGALDDRHCGELIGCLFDVPLKCRDLAGAQVYVDVAAIKVDKPNAFRDLDNLYKDCLLPSLCVELEEVTLEPINASVVTSMYGRQAHGFGARTSMDIALSFADDAVTWVRARASKSQQESNNQQNIVFKCFSGTGSVALQPGDSGTWFWCDNTTLAGMGIGTLVTASFDRQSMILPMADVLQAVREIAF